MDSRMDTIDPSVRHELLTASNEVIEDADYEVVDEEAKTS